MEEVSGGRGAHNERRAWLEGGWKCVPFRKMDASSHWRAPPWYLVNLWNHNNVLAFVVWIKITVENLLVLSGGKDSIQIVIWLYWPFLVPSAMNCSWRAFLSTSLEIMLIIGGCFLQVSVFYTSFSSLFYADIFFNIRCNLNLPLWLNIAYLNFREFEIYLKFVYSLALSRTL